MFYRIALSVLGFLPAALTFAQPKGWLTNPDIVWAAEYTTDFVMNLEDEANPYLVHPNHLDVIQFQNSSVENGLYGRLTYLPKYLSQQLLSDTSRRGFAYYTDSLVEQRMTQDALYRSLVRIDTGYSCEEGGTFFIKNEVEYEQVWCFRVRQLFWYNQKSKAFDCQLLAYAPVVHTRDDEGNIIGSRPLFWLKADSDPPKSFKSKHFNYVFQTKMVDNAPRLEDFKVLKGGLDFKEFFKEEMAAPSRPCFDNSEYKPVSPAVLLEECFGTDTIVTFDDNTYEEVVSVVKRDCIGQIEKVRFVQNWYYDERQHRLYARLVGVAPLSAVRGSEGDFRYYKPLFYQMYR